MTENQFDTVNEPEKNSENKNDKSQQKSIQELKKQNKSKKWQDLGFDSPIENEQMMKKNNSVPNFKYPLKISKEKLSTSFSNIDTIEIADEKTENNKSDKLGKIIDSFFGKISNNPQDSNNEDSKQTDTDQQNDKTENSNTDENNHDSTTEEKSDDNSQENPASNSNDFNDTFCTGIDQDQKIYINDSSSQSRIQKSKKNKSNEDQPDIPPNLKPYVFHSKDSLTYQVLCGEKPSALSAESKAATISDLNKYIDIAADNGLIGEAYYIQSIIKDLKEDNSVNKYNAEKSINDIDQKLIEANAELEEQMKMYAFYFLLSFSLTFFLFSQSCQSLICIF